MQNIRHRLLASVLCVMTGLTGGAAATAGDDYSVPVSLQRTIEFHIAAGPLTSALLSFSSQAHVQVMTPGREVGDAYSPGASGRLTLEAALRSLLTGTGFEFHVAGANSIAVTPRGPAAGADTLAAPPVDPPLLKRVTYSSNRGGPQESAGTSGTNAIANAAPEPETIGEVIVTARRRAENLQVVPISETAISGATLERMEISSAMDLGNHVPNLLVGDASLDPTAFTIGIRGVRTQSQLLLDDPPVGTVYADAVVPHPFGFGDTLDIQSVQVLRGPQGTLFGRNTTGGVVIFDPNPPSIEEGFDGSLKASTGNYDLRQFDGVVNIPLNDVAALRIAGEDKLRDGYTTNVFTGQKWDNVDHKAVRGSLLYRPTDYFTSTTIFDWLDDRSLPASVRLVDVFPGGGSLLGGNAAANALLANQRSLGTYNFASYQGTNGPLDLFAPARCDQDPASPYQTLCRENSQPQALVTVHSIINNTHIDFANFTIANIASYRAGLHDLDGSSTWNTASTVGPSGVGNVAIQKQTFGDTSDELKFTGKAFDHHLDWAAGAIFLAENGSDEAVSFQGVGAAVPPTEFHQLGHANNDAEGVYGQGTYALTNKLKLTGGFRRNYDHRDGSVENTGTNVVTGLVSCSLYNGNSSTFLPVNECSLSGNKKWAANTWTAALDYEVLDSTMVYGSVTRGYKAGGFFFRAVRDDLFQYNPEYVTSYETGVKSDWSLLGRPIRTDLAVYLADYTDQQLPVSDVTQIPITGYVANVGKSRYEGFEFETTLKVTRDLELEAYVSYTDQKYLSYIQPNTGANLSYQTTQEPLMHWLGGLSGTYTFPALPGDGGILDLRADLSARSAVITNNIFPLVFAQYPQPSYTLLNMRADWNHPLGVPINVAIFGTNLSNVAYTTGTTSVAGFSVATIGPPRMFGLELLYKFGEGLKLKE